MAARHRNGYGLRLDDATVYCPQNVERDAGISHKARDLEAEQYQIGTPLSDHSEHSAPNEEGPRGCHRSPPDAPPSASFDTDELFRAVSEEAVKASCLLQNCAAEKQANSELVAVIQRQDVAIKSLLSWCQRFAEEARDQRTKIVEHEQACQQAAHVHAKLLMELEMLKAQTRGKEGEQSPGSRQLKARLQSQADALCRVSSGSGIPNSPAKQRQQPRGGITVAKARPPLGSRPGAAPQTARAQQTVGNTYAGVCSPRHGGKYGPRSTAARSAPLLPPYTTRSSRSCSPPKGPLGMQSECSGRSGSPNGDGRSTRLIKERPPNLGEGAAGVEQGCFRPPSTSRSCSATVSPSHTPRRAASSRATSPHDTKSQAKLASPSSLGGFSSGVCGSANFRFSQRGSGPVGLDGGSPKQSNKSAQAASYTPIGSPSQKTRSAGTPNGPSQTPRSPSSVLPSSPKTTALLRRLSGSPPPSIASQFRYPTAPTQSQAAGGPRCATPPVAVSPRLEAASSANSAAMPHDGVAFSATPAGSATPSDPLHMVPSAASSFDSTRASSAASLAGQIRAAAAVASAISTERLKPCMSPNVARRPGPSSPVAAAMSPPSAAMSPPSSARCSRATYPPNPNESAATDCKSPPGAAILRRPQVAVQVPLQLSAAAAHPISGLL